MKNLTIREKSEMVMLVDFLEWMNKVANEEPMQFETDNEDIAQMYLMHKRDIDKKVIINDGFYHGLAHGGVDFSELP
jgi:gamma-glutamylcyclotransferase (GGCT)/AIG2-like uncharacterized protein YtfP